MNKNVRILVTSVGGGGIGMEIIKALRLSDKKYIIYGADMSPRSLGLFKADKGFVVPPANEPDYISHMVDICKKENIKVLAPGSESELLVLSKRIKIFEELGIYLPVNSNKVIELCLNKKRTFKFLEKNKIDVPKTFAIDKIDMIKEVDFFPVIVKPYVGTGGSKNVFIAQDKGELSFFCKYLLKYGSKPLVQQYIGSYNDEYTVGILFDHESNLISKIALKRYILSGLSNRLKIPSKENKGKILTVSSGISQGEVINDQKLLNKCVYIAKKIKSRGPLNIQCRYVNDHVYPFEINPRISGTTYARALAGINEVDLLIRKYVLGENLLKDIIAKPGIILRGLEEIFIGD